LINGSGLLGAIADTGDARLEAERLIGIVDGIALQALFDPESWPPQRQLDALHVGLGAIS